MNIIKTLKSSISEKGNYCYSLPVETTKEIIKDVEQLQQENQKYKEVIDKIKHILNNLIDYREFVDIVNAIEDVVKEVE